MTRPLKLATRGSPLAMAQAHEVRDRLAAAHPDLAAPGMLEIVEVKVMGDQVLDRPLAEIGGKGLFSKEIDKALTDGVADLAIHSTKDLETWMPDGIRFACVLEREDPRDAFISADGRTLADLKPGAVLGTSSVRRQAQLLARRPDLKVTLFRGNVQTRLKKLQDGVADATFLAFAGLKRLDREDVVSEVLEPEVLLPAVAQGAIGITCREGDAEVMEAVAAIGCPPSWTRVTAERALLEALDGSCRTPIAGLAELNGDRMRLRGLVARLDGSEIIEGEREGLAVDAAAMGQDLGNELKSKAGPDFFPPDP